MKTQHITYVSLGTNQGNKFENLQNAIDLIADEVGDIQKISSIYKTDALGFDGDEFLNAIVKISTYLPPQTVMLTLLNLEKKNRKNSYRKQTVFK
jgi:2-amino-4-hydroxy-6-hydroxymethyldihydropteridine diphosphokinase